MLPFDFVGDLKLYTLVSFPFSLCLFFLIYLSVNSPKLSSISSMTHLCLFQLHFSWSNPLKRRINLALLYIAV